MAHEPVDGRRGAPDVCVIEMGGTVGDIESMPFIEVPTPTSFDRIRALHAVIRAAGQLPGFKVMPVLWPDARALQANNYWVGDILPAYECHGSAQTSVVGSDHILCAFPKGERCSKHKLRGMCRYGQLLPDADFCQNDRIMRGSSDGIKLHRRRRCGSSSSGWARATSAWFT